MFNQRLISQSHLNQILLVNVLLDRIKTFNTAAVLLGWLDALSHQIADAIYYVWQCYVHCSIALRLCTLQLNVSAMLGKVRAITRRYSINHISLAFDRGANQFCKSNVISLTRSYSKLVNS